MQLRGLLPPNAIDGVTERLTPRAVRTDAAVKFDIRSLLGYCSGYLTDAWGIGTGEWSSYWYTSELLSIIGSSPRFSRLSNVPVASVLSSDVWTVWPPVLLGVELDSMPTHRLFPTMLDAVVMFVHAGSPYSIVSLCVPSASSMHTLISFFELYVCIVFVLFLPAVEEDENTGITYGFEERCVDEYCSDPFSV